MSSNICKAALALLTTVIAGCHQPPAGHKVAAIAIMAGLLGGCSQPTAPTASAPRPVKLEIVSFAPSAASDSFVGTLRARQRADLGFESSGRIAAMSVDVGDRVRAGDLLARLDETPAKWRLDKAEADRAAAAASVQERTTQLQQNESLAKDHIISATALESIRAQYRVAVSQLQVADAALSQARRDLSLSRIVAPFDGEIVGRAAEPHTDVGANQPVLKIENQKALELVVMLPEDIANRIAPGQRGSAMTGGPPLGQQKLALTLERISNRSENGSLLQAIFRVNGKTDGLKSGSVVSVTLPGDAHEQLSVPASALLPSDNKGQGTVFVLDPAKNKVARRQVRYEDELLPEGRVAVAFGLSEGERVVVAGAAFLTEGEAAIEYRPTTLLRSQQP
ncbi:efflux RND transporter periplasmic adaptor subunit [Xylophilus sp. GW821-FHT01B05]